MTQPLNQDQGNAYDVLVGMLKQWNLEQLAPDVLRLIQQGHGQDQIPLLLQDTDSYRQRFAGNEVRRKQGMAVLSPAEYLSTEASYRQIMASNGLPVGFYDQASDFSDWIGKDVSPQEISSRVNLAVDAAQRLDDGTKQAFQDYYGIGTDHLAAFFLDQDRALPLVQQQARAARIGAAAANQGMGLFDKATSERLATSTLVADSEIERAMGTAATDSEALSKLGSIYSQPYSATDAANEVFFADSQAARKRKRLVSEEAAQFGGGGGIGRTSLTSDSGKY